MQNIAWEQCIIKLDSELTVSHMNSVRLETVKVGTISSSLEKCKNGCYFLYYGAGFGLRIRQRSKRIIAHLPEPQQWLWWLCRRDWGWHGDFCSGTGAQRDSHWRLKPQHMAPLLWQLIWIRARSPFTFWAGKKHVKKLFKFSLVCIRFNWNLTSCDLGNIDRSFKTLVLGTGNIARLDTKNCSAIMHAEGQKILFPLLPYPHLEEWAFHVVLFYVFSNYYYAEGLCLDTRPHFLQESRSCWWMT